MSLARKHALISGTAWLIISVAFVFILLSLGVDAFAAPTGEKTRNMIASIIVPGYLINFAIIWWSRRGRRAGEIDERDKAIEHRATEITALVMLLVVFLCSIALYDANVDSGTVPVGWFFIMAYGCVALVSLLHPVMTLILDLSGKPNG
jgi:hypothetical protein